MKITSFKSGDYITKTRPLKIELEPAFNETLGMPVEQKPAYNYEFVGKKVLFLGIFNNCIYLNMEERNKIIIPLDSMIESINWQDGWEHYVEIPDFESKELVSDNFKETRLQIAKMKILGIFFVFCVLMIIFISNEMVSTALACISCSILGFGIHHSIEEYFVWKQPD